MSAEILRRAAEEIHRDAQAMCDEEWRFYRAVADWLDDLANRITLSRQLRHEDEERLAVSVAGAYLGEAS